MARALRSVIGSTLAIAAFLFAACGPSPSSNATANKGTPSERPDYKYQGRLDSTSDAVLAVVSLLGSEAKSNSARLYLAEYLMVATDRVSNSSEDGQTWYVTFTMDRKVDSDQGEKAYWEGAAWIVFKDGTVMPSDRRAANAGRILADLRVRSVSQ